MVSNAAYKIIKKAVILRLGRDENIDDILESYPKLSEEQKIQMKEELIEEEWITPSE